MKWAFAPETTAFRRKLNILGDDRNNVVPIKQFMQPSLRESQVYIPRLRSNANTILCACEKSCVGQQDNFEHIKNSVKPTTALFISDIVL